MATFFYFESFSSLLHSIRLIADDVFTGQTMYCKCLFDNKEVEAQWSLSSHQYATINENGKLNIIEDTNSKFLTISCEHDGMSDSKTIIISYDNQLTIECADPIIGESGNIIARYNSTIVQPTWSITSGNQYATISSSGEITISGNGKITVQATYQGYTATKNVSVMYRANTFSQTIIDSDGSITTGAITTTQNPDGSTTIANSSTIVTDDGYISQIQSTIIQNEDGSSTEQSHITNQDGSLSEINKGINSNGSSLIVITNYGIDGSLISQENTEIDVDGNNSTQSIEYDESDNPIVVGYSIDTSDSSSSGKEFNEYGVNTGFYIFDATEGFIMNFHFIIDFTDQPANQDGNLHNIVTMKRANPSPWYGVQIRHSGTSKYITLGTQFETGSNINTNMNPQTKNWIVQNQIAEYNIQITYDPTLSTNNYVVRELIDNRQITSRTGLFPDLPELRYLTTYIGCALDENATPYRYSNINVINFTIEKLTHSPAIPTFTFSNNTIIITCDTSGADIYYRMAGTNSFVLYTGPMQIHSDTTIHTYSMLNNCKSESSMQTFVYDNNIQIPVISCDGEYVEINCSTSGAEIYYRLGTSGSFSLYESLFKINSTVTVYAYASLNGEQSEMAFETCIYSPIVITAPTISRNLNVITISCITPRSTIYYRLGSTGSFQQYESSFEINVDTDVYTYSTYESQTSTTVHQICKYDYTVNYLTFKILTDGTICWKAIGNTAKTIEYKKNDGSWTSIASTSEGAEISVVAGDKVKFRGNNTAYGNDDSIYSAFSGGTSTYNVEGNIMSLIYGDDFINKTAFPSSSSKNFDSIFISAFIVSAENLVLPATALKNDCYRNMFRDCTLLTAAPSLPATTLVYRCYMNMFKNCTSLTTTPSLQAMTLGYGCYQSMFQDCTSLTTAPTLPATTLEQSCYYAMFDGCSSLTTAPTLPATTLEQSCYCSMFGGCTSLTTAPALQATTLRSGCYYSMFQDCTSLTTAPTLPATALEQGCYRSMFEGCTSLTTAPTLPATTLAQNCYYRMFRGCTSLTTAPTLPATTLAQNCCQEMFYGCSQLTTPPTLSATTLAQNCYASMFNNCTSLATAPTLPATTLAQSCYSGMFSNCKALTTPPTLSATTLAQNCYASMFNNSGLTTAPALPATTMQMECYRTMFANCSKLTTAPTLSATALEESCYYGMFLNCTSLTTVPSTLPATTLAKNCYYNMFQGCSSLITPPTLPATTLVENCYYCLFSGCRKLTSITTSQTTFTNCTNWTYNINTTGTFYCPSALGDNSTITRGKDGCPTNWTVVNV